MHSQPYTILDGGSNFSVGILPTRSLGIAQIVGGSFMICLGALVFLVPHYSPVYVAIAMACGSWVVVGGILGLCSAVYTSSTSLNWGNMAFAIVSTCAVILELVIYCLAILDARGCDLSYPYIVYCSNYSSSTGIAIFVSLVALSFAQFGIAVAVITYCCKYGCSLCCYGEARGGVYTSAIVAAPVQPVEMADIPTAHQSHQFDQLPMQ